MSALDPLQRISVPGRLVLGPTLTGPPGTAPTQAPRTSTSGPSSPGVTIGVHQVAYSFVYAGGESALSPAVAVTVGASTTSITQSNPIGLSLPSGVTGVNAYITTAGGSVFYLYSSLPASGTFNASYQQLDATLVLQPTFVGPPAVAYPFGGTPLGFVARAKLVREQVYFPAHSEARGRDAVSMYGGRFRAALAFVLQQYDPDVLRQVWAQSTTSPNGFSGASILSVQQVGNTLQPGALVASSPLLLVADDPTLPSTLVYAPLWTLGPKLELDLVLNKPAETGLVVVAGLDANNLDVRVDKLENLSLT